jgi:hypothetical protein
VTVTLLTYAGGKPCWTRAAGRLARQAYQSDLFHSAEVWDLSALESKNVRGHETVTHLRQQFRQGDGLWSWKPALIRHSLEKLNEGDFLVYLDAGCTLNTTPMARKRFSQYLEIANEADALFFQQAHLEKHWTKPTLRQHFPDPRIWETGQLLGGIQILCKSPRTTAYAEKAFDLSMQNNGELLKPFDQGVEPIEEIALHRHDQSIFSLVAKSFGFPTLQDETYFAPNWSHEGSEFPIWATRLCSGNPDLSMGLLSRARRELERRMPF